MTKTIIYVGGFPLVKAAGYRFERNVPVEVPAELADRILDAQQDDDRPNFAVSPDDESPVQPE